jgi:broad specificity phosphatase PhoE
MVLREMTTTFYLVRHGSNDFFSHTLVGRTPGIHLNEKGRREAEQVAAKLAGERLQRIFSSPLERCVETAAPLARQTGLKVETADALLEVDFGGWTGKTFAELDAQSIEWKQWNAFRSAGRAPGGESMLAVQSRMVEFVQSLRRDFAGERIALFSHGDPLRALAVYFLGTPLEFIRRIEVTPASLTIMAMTGWDVQFLCLGERVTASS